MLTRRLQASDTRKSQPTPGGLEIEAPGGRRVSPAVHHMAAQPSGGTQLVFCSAHPVMSEYVYGPTS